MEYHVSIPSKSYTFGPFRGRNEDEAKAFASRISRTFIGDEPLPVVIHTDTGKRIEFEVSPCKP